MTTASLSNPILNSPYQPPEEHFEIGQNGPTGTPRACRPTLPLRSTAGDDHRYLPTERHDIFVRTVSANDADMHVDAAVVFLGRASAGTTSHPHPPDCKPAVHADAMHTMRPAA